MPRLQFFMSNFKRYLDICWSTGYNRKVPNVLRAAAGDGGTEEAT